MALKWYADTSALQDLWNYSTKDINTSLYQGEAAKEKTLDKCLPKLYNIRTGLEGVIEAISVNKDMSEDNRKDIIALGEKVKEIFNKQFSELPLPIIAGGAIRDTVFGVCPKDYDIFVDLSSIPEEAKDDTCLLIADALQLTESLSDLSMSADGYQINGDNPSGFVCGYECVIEIHENPYVAQILGRNEKPLDTIKSFDYPLVKCWYDISTGKFNFDDEFYQTLRTRKMKIRQGTKTAARYTNWYLRNRNIRDLIEIEYEY